MADEPVSRGARAGAAALFARHGRRVYGLALGCFQGKLHEAEEVVQETFLSVLRAHDKYFKGQPAKVQEARVMDIANKRIIDRFRYHRSRKADPSDCMDELPSDSRRPGDDPAADAVHRLTMDQLWQATSQHLTPTEHQVAVMTWAMGKDDAFIARELGIPTEGTVRSHRCRAIAKIRERLGKNAIFPDDSVEGMTIGDGKGEQA